MRGCRVSTGPRRGLSKLQRELSQTVPLANFAAQVIATSGVLQGRPLQGAGWWDKEWLGHGTEPLQLPEFSTLL